MTTPEQQHGDNAPLHNGDDAQLHRGGSTTGPMTWTAERIRALGTVTDLTTAASIFGLSRATAYELAKRHQFPVAVLHFGRRYRIPVAAILHALHLPARDDKPPDPDPPVVT